MELTTNYEGFLELGDFAEGQVPASIAIVCQTSEDCWHTSATVCVGRARSGLIHPDCFDISALVKIHAFAPPGPGYAH